MTYRLRLRTLQSVSCLLYFPSSFSLPYSTLLLLIPFYHSLSFCVLVHDPIRGQSSRQPSSGEIRRWLWHDESRWVLIQVAHAEITHSSCCFTLYLFDSEKNTETALSFRIINIMFRTSGWIQFLQTNSRKVLFLELLKKRTSLFNQKKTILSLITHPRVVPNP